MTRIVYWRPKEPGGEYRIQMQGHAGYADGGADIVCAAASALCCTLAGRLSYKQMTGSLVMTRCRLSAGEADVGARPVGDGEGVREIFETICTGFAMLCGEYPKHIFLTERTTDERGGPEERDAAQGVSGAGKAEPEKVGGKRKTHSL